MKKRLRYFKDMIIELFILSFKNYYAPFKYKKINSNRSVATI